MAIILAIVFLISSESDAFENVDYFIFDWQ